MISHVKKLEKKMTYNEIQEYLEKHPKWKLPADEDIDELIDQHNATETFHIAGDVKTIDGVECSKTCMGYYSVNTKSTAYLVEKVDGVITNTLFSLAEPVGGLLELSLQHYNSTIINGTQVFNLSKMLDNKKLKDISYMMKSTDLFRI